MPNPMLASGVKGELRFPLLASPKLDGVRCLVINGVAMSRNLKPIPNVHVQRLFGRRELNGLDGELIVARMQPHVRADAYEGVFQATMSGVMSESGEPSVVFHVFDKYDAKGGFQQRFEVAAKVVSAQGKRLPITTVPHHPVNTMQDVEVYETTFLAMGYEGVMLRSLNGPYKHGRASAREGYLLKLKRFQDSEAVVLGTEERRKNNNEAKRNALGHLERSSHKANKVGTDALGALLVQDLYSRVEFKIGTGFDDAQRDKLWRMRKQLIGRIVKYKFQPVGVKEAPRFPVFIGWRDPRDM